MRIFINFHVKLHSVFSRGVATNAAQGNRLTGAEEEPDPDPVAPPSSGSPRLLLLLAGARKSGLKRVSRLGQGKLNPLGSGRPTPPSK